MGISESVVSKFVFFPPECTYTQNSPSNVIFIETKSGKRIPAFYLPAKSKTNTTILYSHGNATDIGGMWYFIKTLRDYLDVNVLHYEYIGYGLAKHEGVPNETNTFESIDAAFDFLIRIKKIAPSDIIAFGTSVGSGPTCYIASKYKLKGVILECPFMSIIRVVSDSVFGRMVDMFDNLDRMSKIRCPVYIMHGKRDNVIPVYHGMELYRNVREPYRYPPCWVEGANHNTILEKMSLKVYMERLNAFINYCQMNKDNNEENEEPAQEQGFFSSLFS